MSAYDLESLLFHAVRCARYHVARRGAYEGMNRFATMLSILLGTAVVADVSKILQINVAWLGVATAVVGVIQLVWDFGGRARTHELLQRRFYDLAAEIRSSQNPSDEDVARWNKELTSIFSDEPPQQPIADAKAYNEAGNAMGMSASEMLVITPKARFLALFGLASGYRFETRGERDARRKEAHSKRLARSGPAPM